MHHIVGDGWSMLVVMRELGALYAGETLPELAIQYADYAVWQRGWLEGAVLDRQVAFWKAHLAGAPSVLELPTDRPRLPMQPFRAGYAPFALDETTTKKLRGLGNRLGATPFMTLLAGFGVLLARYAGQTEVVVGTPIANRTNAQTERLIGFFVNTLALRIRVSEDGAFDGLVEAVKESALAAYAHQDVPFEKIVAALGGPRDLTRTPVFQVMFAMQTAEAGPSSFGGLAVAETTTTEARTAKFDLTAFVEDDGTSFRGQLEYNEDLFDAATIARMARHFEHLLTDLAAGSALSDARLLSDEEHRALVGEPVIAAATVPFHRRFEEAAARSPDAIAVDASEGSLTYGALDARANGLARELQRLGVGPDVVVGLCLERGLGLVVAILAVAKAGGAYLPLDVGYPADRLAAMIEDARPAVVLTSERVVTRLPSSAARTVLIERTVLEDASRLAHDPGPGHLAYVLFTSGSTGRPKGVMVTHGGLASYLAWARDAYAGEGAYGAPVHSPLAFDLTVTSLLLPLMAGHSVVLLDDAATDAEALASALLAHRHAGLVKLTPAHLTALAHLVPPAVAGELTGLFVVGGEALSAETCAFWHRHAPKTRIINEYGPTETVVGCSVYDVREGTTGNVPIGRPIAGTRLFVVDGGLSLVAPGAVGELIVGGAGVARGYVNRPEITAERFVPDPFGAPGARVYRTGDRARLRSDGELEYLGRADDQVKIRGYRIELGEIESALGGLVREVVVTAREDIPGDRRLVAYVVTDTEVEALRGAVAQRLPAYMMPSAFVVLAALPLTPNGKVDRRALPAPELRSERAYVAPQPGLEAQLAAIWSGLLRVPEIGAHDDFFQLGGHSLLATQVMSRVRSALGVELPVRALFETPTIAGLASVIATTTTTDGAPPLARRSGTAPAPASFAQERLWFLDRLDPGSSAYNMPAVLRLSGRLDEPALRSALDALVRRHESLRTTFAEVDGRPVQVVAEPRGMPFVRIDTDASALDAALATELARPFDLAQGPLARVALFRLAETEHVLVLAMHHIVGDGWSMGVLMRDLEVLYGGETLPELPIQYADYAVWQREWLEGAVLDRQLAFWKAHLAGAPSVLELPTDRPRLPMQPFRAGYVPFALPASTGKALRELGQRLGATPFMTLLAGFGVLLARYAGQSEVVIGTPIANRTHAQTERLIGFFVNTLALRIGVEAPSFARLVETVKESALAAYAHQDVPFEKIVAALGGPRDLTRTPVFQVMFSMQRADASPARFGDLAVAELVTTEARTAKFDLTAFVEDDGTSFRGQLEYNEDLFDAATIARMARHFENVLTGLAASPTRALTDARLLSDAEEAMLVGGPLAPPSTVPFHRRFEEAAARSPDAIAVEAGEGSLTYGALNARANGLARELQRLGVGPDVVVGLCLERGLGLVVAILAVAKAGGAYLPLDAGYPAERLAAMLEDAVPSVILMSEGLAGRLPSSPARTVMLEHAATTASENLAHDPGPGHLAYVLFTSGSTGRPKGVMVTHGGLASYLSWARDAYAGEGAYGAPVHSPLAFDLTVTSLLLPLTAGHGVVLLDDAATDAEALASALLAHRHAGLVKLTPAHLTALAHFVPPSEAADLTGLFVVGGEALSAETCAFWHRHAPKTRIINEYGPTETVVGCSVHDVREGTTGNVPIGRPIAGTRLFVVDGGLSLVAPGAVGELIVGGAGVARGYVNRPEITAERFVPDPFGAPGARVYRTGDRARLRSDGELEYLGRADDQVKIRGYRIELGEIEAALGGLVREVVVIAREDIPGERRLVAYVVTDTEVEVLRGAVAQRLPAYMMPSAFVVLAALPLTPNGKVDRRALPAPELRSERVYVAPQPGLEAQLASIWSGLLRVPEIGAHDDFFQLGGHSLLATQLVARTRDELGIELPVRALFEAPTVAQLAKRIAAGTGEPDGVLVTLHEAAGPTLVCVPALSGEPFPYVGLARTLGDVGVVGLRARGLVDLPRDLPTIAERLADAMPDVRGGLLLGWSAGGVLAYEIARQLEARGQGPRGLVLLDSYLNGPRAEAPPPVVAYCESVAAEMALDPGRFADAMGLPSDERDVRLVAELETVLGLDATEIRERIRVFEILGRAVERYVPSGGLSAPVWVLSPVPESARATWRGHLDGATTIVVPGDHYSLLRQPDVVRVSDELKRLFTAQEMR